MEQFSAPPAGGTAPGPPSKDQAALHINQAYLVRSNRLELKLIWAFFCRVVQTVTRLDVSFGSCSVSCVILCIPPTPHPTSEEVKCQRGQP